MLRNLKGGCSFTCSPSTSTANTRTSSHTILRCLISLPLPRLLTGPDRTAVCTGCSSQCTESAGNYHPAQTAALLYCDIIQQHNCEAPRYGGNGVGGRGRGETSHCFDSTVDAHFKVQEISAQLRHPKTNVNTTRDTADLKCHPGGTLSSIEESFIGTLF